MTDLLDDIILSGGGFVDPDRPRGDLQRYRELLDEAIGAEADRDRLGAAAVLSLQLGRPKRALTLIERALSIPAGPTDADHSLGARLLALHLLALHHVVARTPGGGHHTDQLVQHLAGIDLLSATSSISTLLDQQLQLVTDPTVHYEVAVHRDLAPLSMMVAGDSFMAASLTSPPQQGRLLALLGDSIDRMDRAAAVDARLYGPRTRTLGLMSAIRRHRLGDADAALRQIQSVRQSAERDKDSASLLHAIMAEVRLRGCQIGTPMTLDLLGFDGGFGSSRRSDLVAPLQNYPRAATDELAALVAEADAVAATGSCGPSLAAQAALTGAFVAALSHDEATQVDLGRRAERLAAEDGNVELAALAGVGVLLGQLTAGRADEPEGRAAELARLMADDAGVGMALGFGHLIAGLGQRLSTAGERQRAQVAHRTARNYFNTYGAPTLAITQDVDLADLEGPSGRHRSQFDRYQRALEALRSQSSPDANLRIFDIGQRLASTGSGFTDPLWLDRAAGVVRQSWKILSEPGTTKDAWSVSQGPTWAETVASLVDSARHLEVQRAMMAARQSVRKGDEVKASEQFGEALDAAGTAHDGGLLRAIVLAQQGRDDEAMDAYDAAGRGEVVKATLERLDEFGEAGRAVAEAQTLVELRRRAEFASRISRFDVVDESLGELEEASGIDWWQRAEDPADARLLYARSAEAAGDNREGRRWYDEAIGIVSAERRRYASQALRPGAPLAHAAEQAHLGAARLAIRAGRAAEGLDYYEANRAINIVARLRSDQSSLTSAELAYRALAAEADGLRVARQVAEAAGEESFAALHDRLAMLEKQLIQAESSLAPQDDRQDMSERTTPVIAASFPHGTLALTWATIDRDLLTWSMDSTGEVWGFVRPAERGWLEAELHAIRRMVLAEASLAEVEAQGAAVADVLFGEHAERISDAGQILLAPSTTTQSAPLHLIGPMGRALVRDRPVSFLPALSAAVGSRTVGGFGPDAKVAAVGNPRGMSFQRPWDPTPHQARDLPFARTEVNVIADLYGATSITGSKATHSRVRQALMQSQIVHLATHGELLPEAPDFSALLLADGEMLAVHDLVGELPQAALIVLSGCVTAAIEEGDAGQFVGLTRSLLAAGTPSLVSALWELDDLTACLIMIDFHLRLVEGYTPAAALREAQLAIGSLTPVERARRYRAIVGGATPPTRVVVGDVERTPPYYWAGFVAHGR